MEGDQVLFGIFFYDLPVKFRGVRLVELLLFELRGIV